MLIYVWTLLFIRLPSLLRQSLGSDLEVQAPQPAGKPRDTRTCRSDTVHGKRAYTHSGQQSPNRVLGLGHD